MQKQNQAILGGGCFWCMEAVFQKVRGVSSVVSGYCGGHKQNPTYKQVKTGQTGHIEVIKVAYDSTKITFKEILEIFMYLHDPTQSDGQGEDIGSQYLSAIFYASEKQRKQAEEVIAEFQSKIDKKVCTLLKNASIFYKAEDYHQNYFNLKGSQNPYCKIIPPKIAKLKKLFKNHCEQP